MRTGWGWFLLGEQWEPTLREVHYYPGTTGYQILRQ